MDLKKWVSMGAVLCMSVGMLSACGAAAPDVPDVPDNMGTPLPDTDSGYAVDTITDSAQLYAAAALHGGVVAITDTGCTITPTTLTEDTAVQKSNPAADDPDNVTVIYQETCTYHLAIIDIETGAVELQAVEKEEIKKGTQLILSGEFDEAGVLFADAVYLSRYMRE